MQDPRAPPRPRGQNLHLTSSSFGPVKRWEAPLQMRFFCFVLFCFFRFYFIFVSIAYEKIFLKLYIIVLVLPNIKMNPPQVYMCSPSWTLLPPPSPYQPSGSSQCTSPKHPVSWCVFFSGHICLEILEEISGALIVLKKRKATELICAQ